MFGWVIPATLVRVLTPSVSPNEKTFKIALICCSCDPSPHPPSTFGGFSGSFASVCSHPLGVPITSLLFLAAFEDVCLCHQFGSSCHSLFVHCSFPPTQIVLTLKLVWILLDLNELIPTRLQCIVVDYRSNWHAKLETVCCPRRHNINGLTSLTMWML